MIVWVNGVDVTTNSDCVDKSALATGEQRKRPFERWIIYSKVKIFCHALNTANRMLES